MSARRATKVVPRGTKPRSEATQATDPALSQRLRALEESLLRPDVRKSIRLAELIADDFVEYGSSGRIYTKGELVAALQAEAPVAVTASEFNVSLLAAAVALVTYRTLRHSDPPSRALRSSIWRLAGRKWQMIFHQATPSSPPA